jgi:hypothetical protein
MSRRPFASYLNRRNNRAIEATGDCVICDFGPQFGIARGDPLTHRLAVPPLPYGGEGRNIHLLVFGCQHHLFFGAEGLTNTAPKPRIPLPSPSWGKGGTARRREPHVLQFVGGARGWREQMDELFPQTSSSVNSVGARRHGIPPQKNLSHCDIVCVGRIDGRQGIVFFKICVYRIIDRFAGLPL